MRPVDLAREHGLSTQAVRNYEEAGILPAAQRSASGYRHYDARHAQALRAFRALAAGYGSGVAAKIMVAATADRVAEALRRIDDAHAAVVADRAVLDAVERALAQLTAAPARFPDRVAVGEVAHRLRVRPATLRRWERVGLLHPARDPATGYRVYSADDVRDAHLVAQLRDSGHPLDRIADLLDDVRAGSAAAIADRRALLDARARAMLAGAARLDAYLGMLGR